VDAPPFKRTKTDVEEVFGRWAKDFRDLVALENNSKTPSD